MSIRTDAGRWTPAVNTYNLENDARLHTFKGGYLALDPGSGKVPQIQAPLRGNLDVPRTREASPKIYAAGQDWPANADKVAVLGDGTLQALKQNSRFSREFVDVAPSVRHAATGEASPPPELAEQEQIRTAPAGYQGLKGGAPPDRLPDGRIPAEQPFPQFRPAENRHLYRLYDEQIPRESPDSSAASSSDEEDAPGIASFGADFNKERMNESLDFRTYLALKRYSVYSHVMNAELSAGQATPETRSIARELDRAIDRGIELGYGNDAGTVYRGQSTPADQYGKVQTAAGTPTDIAAGTYYRPDQFLSTSQNARTAAAFFGEPEETARAGRRNYFLRIQADKDQGVNLSDILGERNSESSEREILFPRNSQLYVKSVFKNQRLPNEDRDIADVVDADMQKFESL